MTISTWHVTLGWIMAAFLLWLGSMLFLSVTGIHPVLQSETPIAAFLFGTPFALIMAGLGLCIVYLPLKASGLVAQLRGPLLLRHLAGLLWRRPSLTALAAALPPAILALQFGLHGNPLLPAVLALPLTSLEHTLMLEFLLIHGFPFLALSMLHAASGKPGARQSGLGVALLLLVCYLILAVREAGGLLGAILFLYLMLPDLLALSRRQAVHSTLPLLAIRWTQQFILFMTAATLFQGPDFSVAGTRGMGCVFFGALALQELFRIPEIPLEIAAAWKREQWPLQGR